MKRFIDKEQEETTTELTDFIGLKLDDNNRAIIVQIGSDRFGGDRYHAICSVVGYQTTNRALGDSDIDGKSPEDVIQKWKQHCAHTDCTEIVSIWCANSYKELVTWFAEGIKD